MDELDFNDSYAYFAYCLDKTMARIPWPDALYKVIPHTPPDNYYFVRNYDSWLELGTLLAHIQRYQHERNLPEVSNSAWANILSLSDTRGDSIYSKMSSSSLYMVKTTDLPWTDLGNDVLYINLLHKFAMDDINASIEREISDPKSTRQVRPPIVAGILASRHAFNLYGMINSRPDLEDYLAPDLKSFVELTRNIHKPHIFDFVMRFHGTDTSRLLQDATEAGLFGASPTVSSCGSINAYKQALADRTTKMHMFKKQLNRYAIRYHKRVQLPRGDSEASSFKRLRLSFRFNSTQSFESIHKLVLMGLASSFGLYSDKREWKAKVAREVLSGPLCNIKNHYSSFEIVKPLLTLLIDDDYSSRNLIEIYPLLKTLDSTMLSVDAIAWFRELYTKIPESDKHLFVAHLIDTSLANMQSQLQKGSGLDGMHLLHCMLDYLDAATRVDIILRISEMTRREGFDLEDIYTNAFDTHELVGDIETDTYLEYVYVHMQRWLPEYGDEISCALSLGLRLETFLHQIKTDTNKNSLTSGEDQAVELPPLFSF